MNKIVNIVGARPQFVKAALVCRRLRESSVRSVLVHTGQHYDFNMSDVFFQELFLPKPDYFLGVGSENHGAQTGKMLVEIEKVLLQERPAWVMVYGDTNTTLAGALAAAKLHIPVAHVEAGLRSYNKGMPEEINRVLTDHVSSLLLCPSVTAVNNLRKENFSKIFDEGNLAALDSMSNIASPAIYSSPSTTPNSSALVVNVGDVMFDLILESRTLINEAAILDKYGLNRKSYILATIHRPENTDIEENMRGIMFALDYFGQKGVKVFFPAHPRTKKVLTGLNLTNGKQSKNLIIHDPVSYKDMIALEANASLTITDSGGVQKESYFLNTPCIIPRNEVEWVELVDSGWATLTGKSDLEIIDVAERKLNTTATGPWTRVYGDGHAGERISNSFKTICGIRN